jgi:TonB-linked SusC/RagA family outer membrane protein
VLNTRQVLTTAFALLTLIGSAAAQQPTVLTGHVNRDDGTPIGGATVSIHSLGAGTTARPDGSYGLLIPSERAKGQVVAVTARAIGYKPQTVQVTLSEGSIEQNFSLVVNPLQLGEIVVTGAGTVSEVEKLGNVRNSVDSSLIQRSNEPNVVNALSAKAPNVEVTSTSGDPGASTSIRIRGANTLGGPGEPLFVIDGIPIDNSTVTTTTFDGTGFGAAQGTSAPNRASDINPSDIESVEILKGAAAGSVYGARAGQGVILITTKKGHAGATTYSFNSSLSVNDVRRFPKLQSTYGQGDADSLGVPTSDPCVLGGAIDCEGTGDSWGPAIPAGTPTFDHAREVFQTGLMTDNTLAISGGNERTTFYLSGAYNYQDGTFVGPQNNYQRYAFRLKGTHRVSNSFNVGGNVAYSNTNGNFVQKGSNFSGMMVGAWRSPPEFDNREYLDPVTKMHRSYRFPNPSASSFGTSRGYDNPFFTANVPVSSAIADRVFGNVSLEYLPANWLRFNYTLGVDYSGDDRLQGQPQTSSNTPSPLGQVVRFNLANQQVDHNLTGTATYRLNPSMSGSFTLGQNLNTRSTRQVGGTGNSLLAPEPFTLTNTASQTPPIDIETKVRILGYFGQGTLDISDQLFLKAGVRYDGASTFGQDNLRSWYPSASAAWEFTRKTGDLGGVLSYGKLRAAYGEVGTQPNPYLTVSTFLSGGSFPDDGWTGGLTASQNGFGGLFSDTTLATQLKPERTREFEIGTDLGLFNDIADLSFTWYHRKSEDVILTLPVAASTGFVNVATNGAQIRNEGTEWALNIRPITKRNFSWDLGFLFSTNRNRVESLTGAQFVNYGGVGGFGISVAEVGYPVGAFRDYDYIRCGRGLTVLDPAANEVNVDDLCGTTANQQQALFINDGTYSNTGSDAGEGAGYPLLDPDSRIIGDPNPKWTGSIRTGLRYGKISVSGLLDIRHGGVVYNGTHASLNAIGTSKESGDLRGKSVVFGQDFMPGAVAGPGVGTSAVLDQVWFQSYYSSFTSIGQPWYESGSFVKLREISVGYTFTGGFVSRTLGLSSMDVRVAGRNLAVWTDYTGADPETNLAGAETGARGVDWFNNPQTRSFVFSVTLNR